MTVAHKEWAYRIALGRSSAKPELMIDWVDGMQQSMALAQALTEWGQEGWQLVSAVPLGQAGQQATSVQYILRRPNG